MAGGGFGSLDSMNKTLKNNRNLLKKKRGFDILKENFARSKKVRLYKYKKASKGYLKELKITLNRQNKIASIKRSVLLIVIVFIVGFGFYSLMNSSKPNSIAEINKSKYYRTITQPLEYPMVIKTEYFDQANKACTTKYWNGLKHQNSESWYPSGEQFRSAVYWKDTLINEVFFYPNGDTLKRFAETYNSNINYVKIMDNETGNYFTFYYSDGKILPNSFSINQ